MFEFKVNDNESFRFSLKQIIDDCSRFKNEYEFIMGEELGLMERQKKTEEGFIYSTKTIKAKIQEKEIKQTLAEINLKQLESKEEQNLLTHQERGKLALIRESNNALIIYDEENNQDLLKKVKKLGRPIITYNGEEVKEDPILNDINSHYIKIFIIIIISHI